jgi:hypothetical protein
VRTQNTKISISLAKTARILHRRWRKSRFATRTTPANTPTWTDACPNWRALRTCISEPELAVWVGIIALAGVDAETGMIMLLYLEHAYEKWRTEGRMPTVNDLHEPIIDGTVKRMRPKVMTIMGILMGLLLIMWSDGAGADVMKRIVAPRIGGVSTSFLLELPVYSAIFYVWGVGKSGALVGQSKRICEWPFP